MRTKKIYWKKLKKNEYKGDLKSLKYRNHFKCLPFYTKPQLMIVEHYCNESSVLRLWGDTSDISATMTNNVDILTYYQ